MYFPALRFRRIGPAVLLAGLALAGCGGSSEQEAGRTQLVRGPGFSFRAPRGWEPVRTPRSASAAPTEQDAAELVSATVFPLAKRFRASLWPKVVGELDGVAADLASSLGGQVDGSETVRIAGLPGRRYEISYSRDGSDLRQRIAFLLRRRTEYQLLCRWRRSDGEPVACRLLEDSFEPS